MQALAFTTPEALSENISNPVAARTAANTDVVSDNIDIPLSEWPRYTRHWRLQYSAKHILVGLIFAVIAALPALIQAYIVVLQLQGLKP